MDLGHLLNDLARTACISHTPARHGIGLGESVDDHASLLQSLERANRDVLLPTKGQLRIDLVREHDDVSISEYICNTLEIRSLHDRAGGIARIGQDQRLGFWGNRRTKHLGRHLKIIFCRGLQDHGNTAANANHGLVANIARLRNDDLVSRANKRTKRHIDRFRSANRHQDLAIGIKLHLILAIHVSGDLAAKLEQTAVRGVSGLARFQRENSCLSNLPRGREIRLSHAKRDHTLHRLGNIKIFSDTGGRHCGHHRRKNFLVIH